MAMNNTTTLSPKFIVVVGASAGGLHSVIELCAQLTEEMDIAVFVVLHVPHISDNEILTYRIQKNTPFICKTVTDGEPVQRGYIYLAEPDKHLLLKDGIIMLGHGTPENRWRPSIDVLFRSAAVAYKSRTIGIILSGMMQDGVAGMIAIKESGGTCVVQRPEEAEYPDMPRAVINNVDVDYTLSLTAMGAFIQEKSRNGYLDKKDIPSHIIKEAEIAERVALGIENVDPLGERSPYSCPDCGGALWEVMGENLVRYRCHTGHVYNQDELFIRQTEALENTLWIAMRMLEERRDLLRKMIQEEISKGWVRSAEYKHQRLDELNVHIERLKALLFQTQSAVSQF
jgi:two-component system chemotaxis response regulator CheB